MGDATDMLGRVVILSTAQGDRYGVGMVIAIAGFPTYELEDASGDRMAWGVHLSRPATPDEAIAYWRDRACNAERALRAAKAPNP